MKEEKVLIDYAYCDEFIITKEKEVMDDATTHYAARLTINFRRQDANKQDIDRRGMSMALMERDNIPISDSEIFALLPAKIEEFRDFVKAEVAGYVP